MNEKKPFPFLPFVDSLFGEKLLQVWIQTGREEKELIHQLAAKFSAEEFYFTPNAIKQSIMVRYPEQIRKYINERDFESLNRLIFQIGQGTSEGINKPALDVVFELLEWMITGYEDDQMIVNILVRLFDNEGILNQDFVEKVRAEYQKELGV
ncbi:VanZ family protein [Leptospira ilyithenensis]|uniref:VanZ family protein n=1 Tax=Leptospira ilyithenensis TaxID=2484901 RepID=A0A4V3JXH7_9LEPT|nr:VanZ family protein [Leptospira ilyithenensis]TGN14539.1 VanZ family protein [Leptospira ilyithenensis]